MGFAGSYRRGGGGSRSDRRTARRATRHEPDFSTNSLDNRRSPMFYSRGFWDGSAAALPRRAERARRANQEVTRMKKYIAECVGTFTLVLFGCGAAVIAGAQVGVLGIAFAFGFALIAMAYGIGPVSGCHINPAVSLGAFAAGRLSASDLVGYIVGAGHRRHRRRGGALRHRHRGAGRLRRRGLGAGAERLGARATWANTGSARRSSSSSSPPSCSWSRSWDRPRTERPRRSPACRSGSRWW